MNHRLYACLFVLLSLLLCAPAWSAQQQGKVTYIHNDPFGNPVLATDAHGEVVWKESYLPYGAKGNAQGTGTGDSLGFAGKPHDPDTGLSYYGARYYDPQLGRFIGMDPAEVDPEDIHSFNRYAYGANNPYRYTDLDGRSFFDVVFLAYDVAKLGVALYTGVGVGAAAADVALSAVGVLSPVPGTGQALKAARTVDHAVDAVRAADHAADAAKSGRTFQTYTKTNPKTGEVYTGRTSGVGEPYENVARRDASHHMNEKGFGTAILDRSSSNPAAIRGREQQLMEAHGRAKSSGGSSGNAINGISPSNPNRGRYLDAAKKEFGG